jgi:hypothetical protein
VNRQRRVAVLAVFALVASLLSVFGSPAPPAQAATSADARLFDPGNIISDALFFDGGAMTSAQVQSFLNSKVSSCRSGYVCLKDYKQTTTSRSADPGNCTAYAGRANESAADIITRVGAACGISQKALLVLLQKETSLVTDTWPTDGEYRKATGYGCPDTANCNAAYYGFFNQVYMAAIQFNWYAANPQRFGHKPGYVNNVRFHPNAGCGTSPVFIKNQATAGLYNYTPYQPNAAALNNLEGTGDGCSSYGNRNFWRLYTDWFGSPTGASSLARTDASPTVYLIASGVKHAVPTMALLSDLSPLGAVGFVSQSYLDRFQTKQNAGRVIRAPNNDLFFYGSGYKLKFDTCGLVADYGGICDPSGFVQLNDEQISAFATGPAITPMMGTREGPTYYITSGTKREILDDRSRSEAGLPAGKNVLTENALSSLGFGAPVARDSVFVTQRGSDKSYLLTAGTKQDVASSGASLFGLPKSAVGSLRPESLAKLASAPSAFSGVVRGPGDTVDQILVSGGRYAWTSGSVGNGVAASAVNAEFLAKFPAKGSVTDGTFVKTANDAKVYLVSMPGLRLVNDWPALLSFAKGTPSILTVPADLVKGLPKGGTLLAAASLVRSPEDPTVYLLNGVSNKIPLSSFDMATEAGITGLSWVSGSLLKGYATVDKKLGYGLTCGDSKYVAAGGSIHAIAADRLPLYPIAFQALDSYTCAQLTVGKPAGQFIRTDNGAIFQLVDGQRRRVENMSRYTELGGTSDGFISVSSGFLTTMSEGPRA